MDKKCEQSGKVSMSKPFLNEDVVLLKCVNCGYEGYINNNENFRKWDLDISLRYFGMNCGTKTHPVCEECYEESCY